MSPSDVLYLATGTHVCAVSRDQGKTIWVKKLKGAALSGDSFVTLLVDGAHVYAHTRGELFCLDAATGALRWQSSLDGLGYGLASLAVAGASTSPGVAAARRAQSQATAIVATTSATT